MTERQQILQRLYDALQELLDKENDRYKKLDSVRADLRGTVEGLRYDLEITEEQLWGVEFAEEQIAETKARITSLEADIGANGSASMKALLEKRPGLKTRNIAANGSASKKNKSLRWKNADIRKMSEDVLEDIRKQNDLKFDIWKAKAALEVMETSLVHKREIASIKARIGSSSDFAWGSAPETGTNISAADNVGIEAIRANSPEEERDDDVEDISAADNVGNDIVEPVTIETVNLLRSELTKTKNRCALIEEEIKALKDEKKQLKLSLSSLPSGTEFDPESAANMLSEVRNKVRKANVELTRFLRNPLPGYIHEERGGDDLHDEYPNN